MRIAVSRTNLLPLRPPGRRRRRRTDFAFVCRYNEPRTDLFSSRHPVYSVHAARWANGARKRWSNGLRRDLSSSSYSRLTFILRNTQLPRISRLACRPWRPTPAILSSLLSFFLSCFLFFFFHCGCLTTSYVSTRAVRLRLSQERPVVSIKPLLLRFPKLIATNARCPFEKSLAINNHFRKCAWRKPKRDTELCRHVMKFVSDDLAVLWINWSNFWNFIISFRHVSFTSS